MQPSETSNSSPTNNRYRLDRFEKFITEHHYNELVEILKQEDPRAHYSLNFHLILLADCCDLYSIETLDPEELLFNLDTAIQNVAWRILNDEAVQECMVFKPNLHARLYGMGPSSPNYRKLIPQPRDIGIFLTLSAKVFRTSVVKVLQYERAYKCPKCKTEFKVRADPEEHFRIKKPHKCPSDIGCNSTKFEPIETAADSSTENAKDYQEVKLQELTQHLKFGSIPRSISVVLLDDLADSCKVGDDVIITGILKARWKLFIPGQRHDIELFILANHVYVDNETSSFTLVTEEMRESFTRFWSQRRHRPFSARNHILASFCPQIYGLYVVKLGMAMVLAGGVSRDDGSGMRTRGDPHLLLVGDPGTAKSQMLRYAARLVPRSVVTSGNTSTPAGLTVAAVRDGSEWQLEAGALVQADCGLCCIDEFNCMREHDKASIHEAMEQQSISIAKAGFVCKLNSRCTVLACCNPKGKMDLEHSVPVNTALATPLLSRFDLIFVLVDTRNEEWDRAISNAVLFDRTPIASIFEEENNESALWNMATMQAYFAYIKTFKPKMAEKPYLILQRYYQAQRNADMRNAARTTVRMLESLIRLAQGHARLMMKDQVEISDAIAAVCVMECGLQGAALSPNGNALHTRFPTDADQEYRVQAEVILEKVDLAHFWAEEKIRLNKVAFDSDASSHPTKDKENVDAAAAQSQRLPQREPTRGEEVKKYFSQMQGQRPRVDPAENGFTRLKEVRQPATSDRQSGDEDLFDHLSLGVPLPVNSDTVAAATTTTTAVAAVESDHHQQQEGFRSKLSKFVFRKDDETEKEEAIPKRQADPLLFFSKELTDEDFQLDD